MTKPVDQHPDQAPPLLVAHRGYSGRYPENTLLAYEAAEDCGAEYMELDLQMTADAVPVLHHDTSLLRMAGVAVDVRDIRADQLLRLRASYPERFGDRFDDNTFTTFAELCAWLRTHPHVHMFVEFKQATIDRCGVAGFVEAVLNVAKDAGVVQQCVFISFNADIVRRTRAVSAVRTGIALSRWRTAFPPSRSQADFVFCAKGILPRGSAPLPCKSWDWVVYGVDDADMALALARRGVAYIETDEIGTLRERFLQLGLI